MKDMLIKTNQSWALSAEKVMLYSLVILTSLQ